MKSDEDVRMISAEAPVMFAKVGRCRVECLRLNPGWNMTKTVCAQRLLESACPCLRCAVCLATLLFTKPLEGRVLRQLVVYWDSCWVLCKQCGQSLSSTLMQPCAAAAAAIEFTDHAAGTLGTNLIRHCYLAQRSSWHCSPGY